MGEIIEWVPVVLAVIGGASVVAKVMAPLTKTKLDDKLAGWLGKAHAVISKLALNR